MRRGATVRVCTIDARGRAAARGQGQFRHIMESRSGRSRDWRGRASCPLVALSYRPTSQRAATKQRATACATPLALEGLIDPSNLLVCSARAQGGSGVRDHTCAVEPFPQAGRAHLQQSDLSRIVHACKKNRT